MSWEELDAWHMARALELAARGEGFVEPNPMVGCTIVLDGETVGEGFHAHYGGPHAEIEALRVAGPRARGATAYVTLEPCCHQGKTPPCTQALIAAGVRRVVIAQQDPFPRVAGKGIAQLQAAGIEVEVGLCAAEAQRLNAPYLKLTQTGRPWIIAKWAMTLDGKLATHAGDSRWISCPASRAIVHRLRGRVDAILVGRGTAEADDPLLTARPPGARVATRVVVDTSASLSANSQLVLTARDVPVIVAVGAEPSKSCVQTLLDAGCDVFVCEGDSHDARLGALLDQLGARLMTNVLVEGGAQLLGRLFDARQIDEVHTFVAPKIAGGATAVVPIAGQGVGLMTQSLELVEPAIEQIGHDAYIHGRVRRSQ